MSTPFTISDELQQLLDTLKTPEFENNIAYMYVDSSGNITIGVGHNLSANRDVLKLQFIVRRLERKAVIGGDRGHPITNKMLNRPATLTEIQNDFNFLNKHTGLRKYGPEQLESYTTLEMTPESIDQLFAKDLNVAIAVCRLEFGGPFDTFPTTCQAGLIDIAFNCGSFDGFRTVFVPAIKGSGGYSKKTPSEKWTIASHSCHRTQLSPTRNGVVAKWFADGARAPIKT